MLVNAFCFFVVVAGWGGGGGRLLFSRCCYLHGSLYIYVPINSVRFALHYR